MKFLILFLVLLSQTFAHAYDGFRCIPSLRETRLQILVKEETIELYVVNAAGYKFMPQFSTPASVFHLGFFKMQGEDLIGLGDSFAFTWPKDKCELDSKNFVINCNGETLKKVNDINSYGLSTTEIVERHQNTVYEKRRFRLSAEKDNMYFVNLEFYKENCERFNKASL
jgi:hypothetical protein